MEKFIYVLSIEFDAGEGVQFEFVNAYTSLEKAKEALKKQSETEQTSTWIADMEVEDCEVEVTDTSWYCEAMYKDRYTLIEITKVELVD